METSLKTSFAQIFSCCPKNLHCPKFGGAAAPLAPPARTPMFKCLSSDAIITLRLSGSYSSPFYFGVEMLEQSVKLNRLIIFYFISNFLIYAPILPNREPKTSAFRSVFAFRAVFQLHNSCFGRKSKYAANANHCMFLLETGPERIPILRHLDGAFDWLPVSFFVH